MGLALRLDPAQLSEIESDHGTVDDCLTEVLHLWLKKAYDSERFGDPSWTLLARAVGNPAGGNNKALAEMIHEKYGGICVLVCVCLCVRVSVCVCKQGRNNKNHSERAKGMS